MTTSDEAEFQPTRQSTRSLTSSLCAIFSTLVAVFSLNAFAASQLTLGPYSDDNKRLEVIELLEANNLNYQQSSEAGRVSLGYIVVTEIVNSANAGAELVRQIQDAGESDVVYIKSGIYRNRVSAGVYTLNSKATGRTQFLASLGFDFAVYERSRRATLTTIEVISLVDDTLANELRLVKGSGTSESIFQSTNEPEGRYC